MIKFGVTAPGGQYKWLTQEGHKVVYASGFDSVTNLVTTACADGVGVNTEGSNKPSRLMQLKIVPGGTDAEDGRYKLFNLIPVGTRQRYLISTDNEDYYIYATATAFEVNPFSEQLQRQTVTVTLTAEDPNFYLLTPNSITKNISEASPAVFTISNDGEAIGFKLTVKTDAQNTNSLRNVTVKVGDKTLSFTNIINALGSYMVISTVKNSKSATLYTKTGNTSFTAQDVMGLRVDGSTFPQLRARSSTTVTVSVNGTGAGTAKLDFRRGYDFI